MLVAKKMSPSVPFPAVLLGDLQRLTHLPAPSVATWGLVGSIFGSVAPDMEIYRGTQMANPVGYGASKGALLQLMSYLSSLLAPEVRVNAVSPGGIERGQPEAFQKRYCERTPLRRMTTEQDLCGAFAYLTSDMSSYVTGQNLIVDGGYTAW